MQGWLVVVSEHLLVSSELSPLPLDKVDGKGD